MHGETSVLVESEQKEVALCMKPSVHFEYSGYVVLLIIWVPYLRLLPRLPVLRESREVFLTTCNA